MGFFVNEHRAPSGIGDALFLIESIRMRADAEEAQGRTYHPTDAEVDAGNDALYRLCDAGYHPKVVRSAERGDFCAICGKGVVRP